MRDLGLPGPMAGWPSVEVLPGAAEGLAALNGRYRLAAASTAAASDAALIRPARGAGMRPLLLDLNGRAGPEAGAVARSWAEVSRLVERMDDERNP